jgi:hypothetical protein
MNAENSSYVPIREKLATELLRVTRLADPQLSYRGKGFERSEGMLMSIAGKKPPKQAAATVRLGTEPSRGHLVRLNTGRTAWI